MCPAWCYALYSVNTALKWSQLSKDSELLLCSKLCQNFNKQHLLFFTILWVG